MRLLYVQNKIDLAMQLFMDEVKRSRSLHSMRNAGVFFAFDGIESQGYFQRFSIGARPHEPID